VASIRLDHGLEVSRRLDVSLSIHQLLCNNDEAKRWLARRQKKHGKGKALGIPAAKLGRAVYWMLRRQEAFNV
jgi:hypothetical protein